MPRSRGSRPHEIRADAGRRLEGEAHVERADVPRAIVPGRKRRAEADVTLAYKNRFSDVYLLYQPYTYQFNGPFGLRNSYSYAVGVTVSAPIFNRNQGNIARSKLNVNQTQIETANLERQVIYDVEEAVREFDLSLQSVIELDRQSK